MYKIQYIIMKNLKVIQFQGLAPSVFCGLYFADEGAEVTIISRSQSVPMQMKGDKNILNRNKNCIQLNLKNKQHLEMIKTILATADIVIDPYRPGVLEKFNLGPQDLYKINKRIILLRVSGYGQYGKLSLRPGHDLNYCSISGIIPLINKHQENQFISNYFADFVSASLGIVGTQKALLQREHTGEGKVVDCSLADGCTYLAQKILRHQNSQYFQSKISSLIANNDEYIYTTKDGRILNDKAVLELIGQRQYYRSEDGIIQISKITHIQSLDNAKLVNPFSSLQLSNKIKAKGADNQIFLSKIKPKL